MVKKKSLKINFMMNVILTMSSVIFPLISFPYVSRVLQPEGIGKVSFATSLISYFNIIAQLGIPTYGIRACAKVRDNKEQLSKTVHELFIINMIMALISYFILILFILHVPRLHIEKNLYIVISISILLNVIGMEWLYKALEEYSYIAVRSIVFKFIALIAMFLFIQKQNDYVIYGGLTIFASSASNILNFINIRRYVKFKPFKKYNLQIHYNSILTFFAMTCATAIYTNLDTVMLGFMKADVDVGYYNAAIKIKAVLVSVVTSLGAVMLPRSSYYFEHRMYDEFIRISQKAINFVFIIATPLMVFFMLYAKEGVYFLSGKDYTGAIIPMKIIMPTLLLIGLTNIMGIQILVPLGKEKMVLLSVIIGGMFNVIINLMLIPKYASIGSAIGNLFAEIVVFIVQYQILKDIITYIYKSISYLKISISIVIGIIASLWVKLLDLNSFTKLLISGSLFFGIYSVVLIIAKEKYIIELLVQCIDRLKKLKNSTKLLR